MSLLMVAEGGYIQKEARIATRAFSRFLMLLLQICSYTGSSANPSVISQENAIAETEGPGVS
jgi:hypothetical protein